MKKIILCLIALCSITFIQAQTIPTNLETGDYEYHDIVIFDSLSSSEIYEGAREWLALTFNSDYSIYELYNEDKKKIIYDGVINLDTRRIGNITLVNCSVDFKIKLEFKEGKLRYTINRFSHFYEQCAANGTAPVRSRLSDIRTTNWGGKALGAGGQKAIREEVHQKILMLIQNMKNSIHTLTTEENDSW